MNIIGTPRRRVDGRAKVTGQTRFADDIMLPRMVHCKLLRSTVPHARILRIDVSRALAHPGVHLVMTGRDFPIPYGILPVSQDEHALAIDRVRFVGDPVAAVVARDELTAFEALDLIDVEYEPLRTFGDAGREPRRTPSRASTSTATAGNIHKPCRSSSATSRQALRRRRPRVRGHLLLPGQHAPADRAARRRRREGSRRQARALVGDADAALRAPRAREGARHAGRAHPRHRDAERRRLRRQERSVQPRGRRREGGAAPRSAGEDLPDARRSVLLPSRPPSRVDAVQDRRQARRHDHRHARQDAARRRRVRVVRRRQHVLHGRAADRDLSRSRRITFRAAACSRTSRRAGRSADTGRRKAASARRFSSTRSPRRSRSIPPICACGSSSSRTRSPRTTCGSARSVSPNASAA